jgi:hypothetical protein
MPHARKTDPQTSHDAAASVKNLTPTKEFILKALNRPRTDVDLVEAYQNMKFAPRASESGIRSRRAELVAQGLVIDSGARIKLPSGRWATIWRRAEGKQHATDN